MSRPYLIACAVLCLAQTARADVLGIDDAGRAEWVSGGRAVPTSDPSAELARPPFDGRHGRVLRAIDTAAERTQLSPSLIEAIAWTESRLVANARSPKGAMGPMQLMPATARQLGVDPTDLDQNVMGGATYMGSLLAAFDGDLIKALAAYNAGPSAVRRFGGPPPYRETQLYVRTVLQRLAAASNFPPEPVQ